MKRFSLKSLCLLACTLLLCSCMDKASIKPSAAPTQAVPSTLTTNSAENDSPETESSESDSSALEVVTAAEMVSPDSVDYSSLPKLETIDKTLYLNTTAVTDSPFESQVLPSTYAYGFSVSCYKINNRYAANIHFEKQSSDSLSAYLMILNDGIPVPFSIDNTEYLSYPYTLQENLSIHAYFRPDFSLNIGRIDFLFLFLVSNDYCLGSYTVFEDLPKDSVLPEEIYPTTDVNSPTGMDPYGYCMLSGMQASRAQNISDLSQTTVSSDDGLFTLNARIGQASLNRSFFFAGSTPISFTLDGKERTCLDWISDENQLLHLEISANSPGEYYPFCMITVPLADKETSERDNLHPLSTRLYTIKTK